MYYDDNKCRLNLRFVFILFVFILILLSFHSVHSMESSFFNSFSFYFLCFVIGLNAFQLICSVVCSSFLLCGIIQIEPKKIVHVFFENKKKLRIKRKKMRIKKKIENKKTLEATRNIMATREGKKTQKRIINQNVVDDDVVLDI